jgi:hypothetical protein
MFAVGQNAKFLAAKQVVHVVTSFLQRIKRTNLLHKAPRPKSQSHFITNCLINKAILGPSNMTHERRSRLDASDR